MKFSIEKKKIQEALKFSSSVCNLNASTSPILSSLYIIVTKENITIISSNNYVSGKYVITNNDYECLEEGKFLIKSKIICEIINKMEDGIITFTQLETLELGIKNGNWSSQLLLLPYEQYPELNFEIPDNSETREVMIKTNYLLEVEDKLTNLISTSDTFNVFSTFGFKIKENKLTVIATDTFKLGRLTFTTSNSPDISFNIEPSTIKLISSLFRNDEEVKIKFNGIKLRIDYNNITLISRLYDGSFPPVQELFQYEGFNRFTVERRKIINSLELGLVVDANKKTPTAELSVNEENKLECLFNSNEIGSTTGVIEISGVEGQNIKTYLNSILLISILKNFNGNEVVFYSKPGKNVVVFHDPEQENFEQVLAIVSSKK